MAGSEVAMKSEELGFEEYREATESLKNIFPDKEEAILLTVLQQYSPQDSQIVDKAVASLLDLHSTPRIENEVSNSPNPARKRVKLNEGGGDGKSPPSPGAIIEKIQELQARFPDMDPNRIYHRLENAEDIDIAAQQFIDELTVLPLDQTFTDASDVAGPSNQGKTPQFGRKESTELDESEIAGPSGLQHEESLTAFLSEEERDGVKMLVDMFPQVDPYYVTEKIARDRMKPEDLVEQMTRDSGYPKLKERVEKENRAKRRAAFLSQRRFNPKEFLRLFPKPLEYFMDIERAVDDRYVRHSKVKIHNDFPQIKETHLDQVLASFNNHYYPAYRKIQEDVLLATQETIQDEHTPQTRKGRGGRSRKKNISKTSIFQRNTRQKQEFPDDIDEQFFREVQFRKFEHIIEDYQRNIKERREKRVEEATAKGELEECGCCFLDDILPEDMRKCSRKTHKFCAPCVTQHAQVQIADEGKSGVKCMEDGCDGEFTVASLRDLLKPKLMELMLRQIQQDELRKANIENMETCPACDFALIIENDHIKVFKCQNPDCMKETCRKCKEASHIPLRCNEVEKSCEVRMRTFVENAMAEAMIRVCSQCSKRIIKSDGCNKMSCPCGAYICYVCGKLLDHNDPYGHFSPKGCPQMTSLEKLHAEVAEKAGKEAKEKFLKENPEMKDKRDVEVKALVDRKSDGRGDMGYESSDDEHDSEGEEDLGSEDSDDEEVGLLRYDSDQDADWLEGINNRVAPATGLFAGNNGEVIQDSFIDDEELLETDSSDTSESEED